MVDASTVGASSAASPSTDERETEVLSGLTRLALELARTFQAEAVAALAAGDLDRAGKAETRFSSLFLAIRRAVALKLRRRREVLTAASPAAIEADAAMTSELMELAEELARGFHALALAALAAGDLDRAGTAETRFSSLFLGIRRAIALKARLRQEREAARREAEHRRESRQDETDDRRHAVAQGVAAAIAAVPDTEAPDTEAPDTEAKEQLTADLWEKLTEDERIDVDLADTALPIEALIANLCRALGIPPGGIPPAGGPPAATAKAGTDGPGTGPKGGRRMHSLAAGESSTGTGNSSRRRTGTTGRPPAPARPPRPPPILLRPRGPP
ncbi:hypothetical protein ACFW16_18875 [Inquilinus sp. NPDC058860]|uniref:hypothetical protein n=1 Tax=Inquilinus sp. NPDC058860 TaxID=3346652 RepID=UPI0036794733